MIKYYNLLWVFLGGTLLLIFTVPDYKVIKLTNGGKHIIEQDIRNGEVSTFYPAGNVKTTITYDKDVKNGPATRYYSNGKIQLEMKFVNGKREGVSKKYYMNGCLYATTPYSNNKINGERITYYDDGSIKAKAQYFNNLHGTGLIEYTTTGNRIPERRINIETDFYNGHDILKFTIPDCYREAFYTGKLVNGKYLDPSAKGVNPLPSTDGYHFVKIENINEGDEVICSCTTRGGNTYVTSRPINFTDQASISSAEVISISSQK